MRKSVLEKGELGFCNGWMDIQKFWGTGLDFLDFTF